MSDTTKHVMDWMTFLASAATLADMFTKILAFFVTLAGLVWWGIRYYNMIKEKRDGNKRFNELDS
jgi:hypothetical protein